MYLHINCEYSLSLVKKSKRTVYLKNPEEISMDSMLFEMTGMI